MNSYQVTLTGTFPLLLHRDNIEFADQLTAWRSLPENAKLSRAGDDRQPAFTWLGCLYDHDGLVVMASDNIMRAAMEGGASVPVPGGKSGKTFKAQTQSGMLVVDPGWPIIVDGKEISATDLYKLRKEPMFDAHQQAARDCGFSLFVKRAKIGQSKHIRVRPRFDRWSISGRVDVWDDQITKTVLATILTYAGEYKGLGDWRPSSKTPGPWGRFEASVEKI